MRLRNKITGLSLLLLLIGLFALGWSRAQAARPGNTTASPAGTSLYFLPTIARQGVPLNCLFVEENGIVVMEVEANPPLEAWVVERAVPGYTGNSYYTWRGPNLFGIPGVAILRYPVRLNQAGSYLLRIHNYHDFPDPTEENDVWARMDGGPWIKVFSSLRGEWTWRTAFDINGGADAIYEYLGTGDHVLELSARSYGFSIDRIALFRPGTDGENLSLPQSACVLP